MSALSTVKRKLVKDGYIVHDFDLVAISPKRVLLVKVKSQAMTRAEFQNLRDIKVPPYVQKQVWEFVRGSWNVIQV